MVTVLLQNSITGVTLDISLLVSSLTVDTKLEEEPSKLEVQIIDTAELEISNGSAISVKDKENKIFFGYVFKYERSTGGASTITAYDQLRYLKYKDSRILGNSTIGTLFAEVCRIQGLNYKILDNDSTIIPEKVFDNSSYYEMIKFGIDYIKIYAKRFFTVMDLGGTLVLVELDRLKQYKVALGDESLLTGYNYSRSIDGETYNSIKLVHEDKDSKIVQYAEVADPRTGKSWGALRHFQKVDNLRGTLNDMAKQMLEYYNREEKELQITTIGDWSIRAGVGVPIQISELDKEGFNVIKMFVVESCTHNVGETHTMDLKLVVV